MRLKSDPQRYFHWSTASTSKIVWRYEETFNRISETLDDSPKILDLVATAGLRKLGTESRRGCKATYNATCKAPRSGRDERRFNGIADRGEALGR